MTKQNVTTLYDEQCKTVLSSPQILAYMIKNCVLECKNISMNELVEYFQKHPAKIDIEDISISDGKIIYEIQIQLFCKESLIINIEPQNSAYLRYNLGLRSTYYTSCLISNQRGTKFQYSDFNDIKRYIPF